MLSVLSLVPTILYLSLFSLHFSIHVQTGGVLLPVYFAVYLLRTIFLPTYIFKLMLHP
jgi:hypothetical protein